MSPSSKSTLSPEESLPRQGSFAKDADSEAFLCSLNETLAARLPPLSSLPNAPALPIVYICGPPRSGTTLLSQLLSRHLPVGYVDNVVARFWLRPDVGIRMSRALLGPSARASIAFSSKHGVSDGLAGPHEFGYFWAHWLRLSHSPTHKLGEEDLRAIDSDGLRQALESQMLSVFEAPVVFKNVICGFQAAFLSRIHPASLFVRTTRDNAETARSILKARLERYGSYSAWWSLRPGSYAQLLTDPNPVRQVVGQVVDCDLEFDRELSRPTVHSMSVSYADLTRDPQGVLDRVCAAVGNLGYPMAPVERAPHSFKPTTRTLLPAVMEADLVAALSETGK